MERYNSSTLEYIDGESDFILFCAVLIMLNKLHLNNISTIWVYDIVECYRQKFETNSILEHWNIYKPKQIAEELINKYTNNSEPENDLFIVEI